ncbi:MAG: alanine dehydrogenase [Candidatus Lambdaproteobacteria bacterium]|nr:alanine dehydrogenase [Candidatus Lambdaproteobacteria bacterium]
MDIGIPKEIKAQENRVALTPAGAHSLAAHGHRVWVQAGAGQGSGFDDDAYRAVGAELLPDAPAVFRAAQLILKVKEPLPEEWPLLRADHLLFTYLHLAPAPELTRALCEIGLTAVAYETVQDHQGRLPLLVPMSEVAGRMSIQVGALSLENHMGGRGVLLGGIPGVRPARVVILGGGAVGANAARVAVGMGADVVLLDVNMNTLTRLDEQYAGRLKTLASTPFAVREEVRNADLVVGAVLVTGARAPHLVTREMLREMKRGAVIVDVAIDQGGCTETSRPTTHDRPTYIEEGVVHYCVTNMPGAVARTSTVGLTNVTLPYALKLAEGGLRALAADPALGSGLNLHRGHIVHPAVAEAMGVAATPFSG